MALTKLQGREMGTQQVTIERGPVRDPVVTTRFTLIVNVKPPS